jgi:hypothetical protein
MKNYVVVSFATLTATLCASEARADSCACTSTTTLSATSAGSDIAVEGVSSGSGQGVLAINTGTGIGLTASALSEYAIFANAQYGGTSISGVAGVYAMSASSFGYGISGSNSSTGSPNSAEPGTGSGVYGTTSVLGGVGVYGTNSSSSTSAIEYGVAGVATASASTGIGVVGFGGIYGVAGNSPSAIGNGVYGSNTSTGNAGGNGQGCGVYGSSSTAGGAGVYGSGITGSTGVYGTSVTAPGVYGISTASGLAGVSGENDMATGIGVYGYATGGGSSWGVRGYNNGSGNGVEGDTFGRGASGVYGFNNNQGYGVAGRTSGVGIAIYGDNPNNAGWSGYFTGEVDIQSTLWFNGTCYYPSGACSSDVRLKKNIQSLGDGALDDLAKLRAVTFEWKEPGAHGPAGTQLGFIAQEVEKVRPDWVTVDDQGFKAVNLKGLEVMLVASVGTLKASNDALRAQAADLQDRVKSLEAGRRPMISGFGEGGIGLGLFAVACAIMVSQRRSGAASKVTGKP